MKKLLSLTLSLLLLFSICSCSATEPNIDNETLDAQTLPLDMHEIRVAVLNGTTGFGIAPLYENIQNGTNYYTNVTIDFYADATLVAPLIIGGSVDIAAVPTNLAATLYNKTNGGIEVLAVNTLGVLYLVENGESVKTINDLAGKTVYLPGSGTNPEFILKTILSIHGLENKVTLDYTYATPDELTAALASGNASIGVLPEPKVTAATMKNSNLRVAIDFTNEWKTAFGTELVQGCLIARKEFIKDHPIAVENFLKAYEESINKLNADVDTAADSIVAAGIAPNKELVKKALPHCNIVYMDGVDIREPLTSFWSALYNLAPNSIGGAIPDENIFG